MAVRGFPEWNDVGRVAPCSGPTVVFSRGGGRVFPWFVEELGEQAGGHDGSFGCRVVGSGIVRWFIGGHVGRGGGQGGKTQSAGSDVGIIVSYVAGRGRVENRAVGSKDGIENARTVEKDCIVVVKPTCGNFSFKAFLRKFRFSLSDCHLILTSPPIPHLSPMEGICDDGR
jgi:hypothetical protein